MVDGRTKRQARKKKGSDIVIVSRKNGGNQQNNQPQSRGNNRKSQEEQVVSSFMPKGEETSFKSQFYPMEQTSCGQTKKWLNEQNKKWE